MPLGAARIAFIAKSQVTAVAEVIRAKVGVTAFGNAQVDTAQSKFGGASALFDGTTDLLITESTNNFAFGSNQYTIETWIRLNASSKQHSFFDIRAASGNDWVIYVTNTMKLEIFTGSTGTGSTNLSTGVWYHVAVVRDATNLKVYLNGSQEISITAPSISGARSLRIGGGRDGGSFSNTDLNGWMDEVRVSNTARYTANFTAPTAAFVNDANTLLLLHMDGADGSTVFEDDNGVRTPVGVTAVGNAQVDTAESKFGGASALFDGTGDYLTATGLDLTPYATADFTVEGWVRINSLATIQNLWSIGAKSDGFAFCRLLLYTDGDIAFLAANSTPNGELVSLQTTNGPITTNTWYHIAIVRNGNNFNVYVNGSSVLSTTNSGAVYTGSNISYLGTRLSGSTFGLFQNGWTDEFRISNTARYTANFTPSTAPFQNDANTLLLLHMDGADTSTYFPDDIGNPYEYTLGTVYSVGNSGSTVSSTGTLGDNTTANRSTLTSINVTDARAVGGSGAYNGYFINAGNQLWGWGDNAFGAVGDGTTTDRGSPVLINSTIIWDKFINSGGVPGDSYFYGAIDSSGYLYMWGVNTNGQLGLGDTTQRNSPTRVGTKTWRMVCKGNKHCVGIDTDGKLWAWGDATDQQLGQGNTTQQNSPVQIGSATNWTWCAAGLNATSAINSSGELYSVGYNLNYQLGNGSTSTITSLTKIGTDTDWKEVHIGQQASIAIKTDGTWYRAGSRNNYRNSASTTSGTDNTFTLTNNTVTPAKMQLFDVGGWVIEESTGKIWNWGLNSSGELARGNTTTPLIQNYADSSSTGWIDIAQIGRAYIALKQNT